MGTCDITLILILSPKIKNEMKKKINNKKNKLSLRYCGSDTLTTLVTKLLFLPSKI